MQVGSTWRKHAGSASDHGKASGSTRVNAFGVRLTSIPSVFIRGARTNAHLQELLHSLDTAALGGAQNRSRAYACIVDATLGSSLTQQLDTLNASVVRGAGERGVLPAIRH